MPRFLVGDDLGAVRSVTYSQDTEGKKWVAASSVLCGDAAGGRARAVQKLALRTAGEGEEALVCALRPASSFRLLTSLQVKLAALRADGSSSVLRLDPAEPTASEPLQWTENRLKDGQKFVGAAFTHAYVAAHPARFAPHAAAT